ncbi:MAG TPA: methyltransferase [Nitrospirota bacterium]|nr:methyltransferase [Nitrospirota bacterium]
MDKNLLKQIQEFTNLWGGFRASRVVLTANNLMVFEHLRSPATANDVASSVSLDLRATEILLDALTALGLLKKTGNKYRSTEMAKRFLDMRSPLYQGDMLRHADSLWKSWSGLDEVVRSGQPNRSGGRDHESFIRAMHNNAVFRATDVIKAIDVRSFKKALDLGGGPGTYSMELARKGVSVTLFDLPNTVDISEKLITESGIRNIDFIRGDFHSDGIGTGYDLVFISQIFHSLSADDNLMLIKKARSAMNPKGKIAIHEFILEKNRAFPIPGALFSVNMLVNTSSGRCYTSQEMKAWLKQTGFGGIRTKILNDTVVLTGIRS